MSDIHERVKKLNEAIVELQGYLVKTEQIIKNLESKNCLEIQQKEKELEDWRQKLEVLQQERNQIRKEIKEKVQELEQSQLSNSEKQAQINQLLTAHSQELEEVDKLLYEERTQYRQIRDKLIGKLCEPCPTCRTKEQVIQQKDKKITYLFMLIGTLLILGFLFHLWFAWFAVPRYVRKLRVKITAKT
jgi:chromosome segregation ATPase